MKTHKIAGLSALGLVFSSVVVLVLVLLSATSLTFLLQGCTQAAAGFGQPESTASQSAEALHTATSAVTELRLPEERYAGLLRLHLQHPRDLLPVIYLAQIDIAAGKISAAEAWLQAARDSGGGEGPFVPAPDYETELMWYLSARSAYERQKIHKCLSYLEKMKGEAEAEEDNGGSGAGAAPEHSPDDYSRRAELLKRARVLEVKALMHGARDSQGEDSKAVCELLDLVLTRSPMLLSNEVILQGADICRQEDRYKRASDLLQHYCRRRPFDPAHWEIAANLCKACGLDAEAYLIRHEAAAFVQSGQESLGSFTGADKRFLEAVHRFQLQQWEEAFELLHMLLGEGTLPRHRFADYMYAVCRIYSRPRERDARERYTRMAELYGDQQLYFVHLYRALSQAEDVDASVLKLLEQALRGCIAAGPHTEWADEARAHLAQLAGLAPELGAEPLLKEEMQQLAGFVWEGASPTFLQPLIDTLEWPDNHYTLEAGLLLRQLRLIPGVDAYIAHRQKLAGERGKERIRAILKF